MLERCPPVPHGRKTLGMVPLLDKRPLLPKVGSLLIPGRPENTEVVANIGQCPFDMAATRPANVPPACLPNFTPEKMTWRKHVSFSLRRMICSEVFSNQVILVRPSSTTKDQFVKRASKIFFPGSIFSIASLGNGCRTHPKTYRFPWSPETSVRFPRNLYWSTIEREQRPFFITQRRADGNLQRLAAVRRYHIL